VSNTPEDIIIMINYQVELFKDIYEEMYPTLLEHCAEVHKFADTMPLSPDKEKYQVMQEAGVLQIVSVRDSGKLVGYSVDFVTENLHYKEHLYASNDIIFIDPAYRHTGIAKELFEFVHEKLKERGVTATVVSMKSNKTFKALCEAVDMEPFEVSYIKDLRS
jgi:GNAT superfamily N-acetyltransferase